MRSAGRAPNERVDRAGIVVLDPVAALRAAIVLPADADPGVLLVRPVRREEMGRAADLVGAGDRPVVGEPAPSGKVHKATGTVVQGISSEKAKQIAKTIRDEKLKGVQAQIQGDQLRVSGKKKDDLQRVIGLLKGQDFGIPLQFVNYR